MTDNEKGKEVHTYADVVYSVTSTYQIING